MECDGAAIWHGGATSVISSLTPYQKLSYKWCHDDSARVTPLLYKRFNYDGMWVTPPFAHAMKVLPYKWCHDDSARVTPLLYKRFHYDGMWVTPPFAHAMKVLPYKWCHYDGMWVTPPFVHAMKVLHDGQHWLCTPRRANINVSLLLTSD